MSGSRPYAIAYLPSVVKEDVPSLPTSVKPTIINAIETCLMIDPIGFGKSLRYSLKGHRRLRVSDYRIVFRIDVKLHTVIIVAIKHRKQVYKEF